MEVFYSKANIEETEYHYHERLQMGVIMLIAKLPINKTLFIAVSLCILLAGFSSADAASGTLGCSGSWFYIGADHHFTVYQLHNFNDSKTISIDQILVYDKNGNLLCDYPDIDSFPEYYPDFKSILGPYEYSGFRTFEMQHCHNPSLTRGMTVLINWSSPGIGVMPLDVRQLDVVRTGTLDSSRAIIDCKPIKKEPLGRDK